jgi:hypothetical protein
VPDLRNDRARLAAEADALRHTLAEHRMQAAASSSELTVHVQWSSSWTRGLHVHDVWQGSMQRKGSVMADLVHLPAAARSRGCQGGGAPSWARAPGVCPCHRASPEVC